MTGTWGRDIFYPTGLLSLVASIKEDKGDIELLDLEYLTRSKLIDINSDSFFPDAVEMILSYDSEVVGFGTLAVNYHFVIELSRQLKKASPNTKIIFGGPQASATATPTLKAFHEFIDVIVIGEGERTINNVLNTNLTADDFQNIPGIAFWNGTDVVQTDPVSLVDDLDHLPFEHLSKEMIDSYSALCEKERMKPFYYNIEIGRGCPYRCSFCATSPMWRRADRRKTPARMFDEMNRAAQYGMKAFSLTHDNFTANREHMYEFCNYLIEQGSPYKWTISSRGDAISDEGIRLLKKAGCCGLFVGMEAGSKHMQRVFKKNLDLAKSCASIKLCDEEGIGVSSVFLLGHPEETEDDANQTILMALRLATMPHAKIDLAKLCPLNGSLDYENYREGLLYTSNTCDVARCPFQFDVTERLIVDHPDIFSAFYAFPCRYMDDDELCLLIEFYEVMLEHYPVLACEIFEKEKLSPLALFRMWNEWRSSNYADSIVDQNWIHQTFAQYFRQVILK